MGCQNGCWTYRGVPAWRPYLPSYFQLRYGLWAVSPRYNVHKFVVSVHWVKSMQIPDCRQKCRWWPVCSQAGLKTCSQETCCSQTCGSQETQKRWAPRWQVYRLSPCCSVVLVHTSAESPSFTLLAFSLSLTHNCGLRWLNRAYTMGVEWDAAKWEVRQFCHRRALLRWL